MRRLLALALLLAPIALRAEIAEDIQARLQPFQILRGEFSQAKSIRILKKPLKSSGSFVLVRGKGVLWSTAKPMASLLKVTQNEITQIKEGKAAFSLKAGEQPALKLVGRVLFAVFSADLAALKQDFEIKGSVEGGHWKAQLSPKQAWIAKAAKRITLEGGKALQGIEIDEMNGDHTAIHFSKVDLKASLTPAEKALFE
jgi:hypothetical protein